MEAQNIDKQLATETKSAEKTKTTMDSQKATLDDVTAKYNSKKAIHDKYQARVDNANAVAKITDLLTGPENEGVEPINKGIKNLKSRVLQLRWQAEDALQLVLDAKGTSDALEAHIANQTKANEPVSDDLVKDSPEVNAALAKAWDDAAAAYAGLMATVELVTSVDKTLDAVNEQLRLIDTPDNENLEAIRKHFSSLGPNPQSLEKLELSKDKASKDYLKTEEVYKKITDKIEVLKAKKAVKDAINA